MKKEPKLVEEDLKMLNISLGQVLSEDTRIANGAAKNLKYLESKYGVSGIDLIEMAKTETKLIEYPHTREYPNIQIKSQLTKIFEEAQAVGADKHKMKKETVYCEFNELVFSRENPKFIYRDKNATEIFKKLKVGDEVCFKKGILVWCGEITKISGKIGLEVKIY